MQRTILETIKNKRLIFTITTGRSGTAYLASIFGYAKGVDAFHEPSPEFVDVLREVQGDPIQAKLFMLEHKLPAIARTSSRVYVETSHLACKGFFEPLLDIGIVPDLIIHRRAKRDVALSMFRMGTIPGRSDKGLKFYLSPEDPGVLPLGDWQGLTDYQICFWYCLEIERRAQHYRKLFSQYGGRIVETTLPGLKSFKGLVDCFDGLGLEVKTPKWLTGLRFYRSSQVKVNESRETKKPVEIPVDLDQLEEEVWQNVNREDLLEYFPEKLINQRR